MKKVLKVLIAIAAIGAIAFGIVLFISAGDREMAEKFIAYSSTGQYDDAFALMHPALQEEFPLARFAVFDDTEPYTNTSFSSINVQNGVTTLQGTTSTDSGCTSQASFTIIGEQITAFNITPLCKQ